MVWKMQCLQPALRPPCDCYVIAENDVFGAIKDGRQNSKAIPPFCFLSMKVLDVLVR